MEPKHFERLNLKKIVCGANHVVVLAGKTLFAWGNSETGQTGRSPNIVKKYFNEDGSEKVEGSKLQYAKSKLKPQKLLTKNVVDVFTALNHSFLYTQQGKRKVLKGWGFNRHGQLGNGHRENVWIPEEITFFSSKNLEVKDITGGDFHTLFLTTNNEIYSCGKNDEGQLGVEIPKLTESKDIRDDLTHTDKMNDDKKSPEVNNENDDLALFPLKVDFFNAESRPANRIRSSMNFNYALDSGKNQVYSWGFGMSYVLGNKDETNETSPFSIPQQFFKNLNVVDVLIKLF
jgi:alpha-tubulin suppressor-like RCC1 family protein